jgi:hypothetical protein
MASSPSDGFKAALTLECGNAGLQGEHRQKHSRNRLTRVQRRLEETAEVFHVSPDAVKRVWRSTRLWLFREHVGAGRYRPGACGVLVELPPRLLS